MTMSSQPLHTRVHDRVETAFTISGIRMQGVYVKNQTANDGENNRTKPYAVDGPEPAAARTPNIFSILALALVIHSHRCTST
jgi:hypothetical protein